MVALNSHRTTQGILGLGDSFFASRLLFFRTSLRDLIRFGLLSSEAAGFSGLKWGQFGLIGHSGFL
jgi:hypothetical protein